MFYSCRLGCNYQLWLQMGDPDKQVSPGRCQAVESHLHPPKPIQRVLRTLGAREEWQGPSARPDTAPRSGTVHAGHWQTVTKGHSRTRPGEAWRELGRQLVAQALQDGNPLINNLGKTALFPLFS